MDNLSRARSIRNKREQIGSRDAAMMDCLMSASKREEIRSKCDAAMMDHLLEIIDSLELSSPSVVKDRSCNDV
ncbi:MAG: hypothetical protein WAM14_01360 [Candidatus Nitrosopolaris sp.]